MNCNHNTNSIIALLSTKAYERAFPSPPETVWLGLERIVRGLLEEDERTPISWLKGWTSQSRSVFFESLSGVSANYEDVDSSLNIASISKMKRSSQLSSKDEPVLWNIVPNDEGCVISDKAKVVGILSPHDDFKNVKTIKLLESAVQTQAQVWWQLPSSFFLDAPSQESDPYLLSERLGVALFVLPPKTTQGQQEYKNALIQSAFLIGKSSSWNQWLFPTCDILEDCFYDLILQNKNFSSAPPVWFPVGVDDWIGLKRAVWSSFCKGLGSEVIAEELLCAYVLSRVYPLIKYDTPLI